MRQLAWIVVTVALIAIGSSGCDSNSAATAACAAQQNGFRCSGCCEANGASVGVLVNGNCKCRGTSSGAKPASGGGGSATGAGASGGGAAPSGGGTSFGVKECDDFVAAWEACYKDPAKRAAAEPAFKAMRESWAQQAKDPNSKAGLAMVCKSMSEQLKSNPACK
jgi:hypothetical protein